MPSSRTVGQDLVFRLAAPERVLRLERSDRVDRHGPADGRRGGLGEAEVAHLPGPDQLRHRPDGLLDRRVRVDPVLVVEVDDVHAESPEACVAAVPDVLRIAPDAEELAVRAADVSELRREHHPVATVADRPADELLVPARAVHVGRVEEVPARVEVAVDDPDRLGVVHLLRVVELAHPHAAESDCGDAEAARS